MAKSRLEYREEIQRLNNRHDALMIDYKSLRKMYDETHLELIQRREEVKVLMRVIRRGE